MAKLTFRNYLNLIKLLRIDVFFLLSIFGIYMPSVTVNQLAQDKYCLNSFGVNESICQHLETAGSEYELIRNQVLEKATTVKMYMTILQTLPGLFFSLFLGYWIDTYPSHLRFLLSLCPLAGVVSNLTIIYQCIYFDMAPMSLLYSMIAPAFTGTMVVIMTGAYTYITRKTPAKYRAIRFAILELFLFIAIPLSTTVGGAVLAMEPWFANQHRNYIGVLIIATTSLAIASVWVVVLLDDAVHDNPDEDKAAEVGEKNDDCEGTDEHDKKIDSTVDGNGESRVREKKKGKAILLDIINVRNVTSTLRTAFKHRDHNGRLCLLLSMLSMAICMIGYMGENSIGFQFTQRVYHWDAEYYSYMSALIISIPAIVTTITPPILIHKFHFHDTSIGILGSVSLAAAMFVRGLVLSPPGFFLGVIFGSFVGLLPIVNRSIVSRIIRYDEIGQIYALLSCIESAGPLISSVFYSEIFKATINNSPGTVYLAAGFVVLVPLAVIIWLYFTKETWDHVLLRESEADKLADQTIPNQEVSKVQDESFEARSSSVRNSKVIYHHSSNRIETTVDRENEGYAIDDERISTSEVIIEKVEIIIEESTQSESNNQVD